MQTDHRSVNRRRRDRRLTHLAGLVACVVAGVAPAHAQGAAAQPGFAPGGRQLVLLDFSTFPLGPIPPQLLGQAGMSNLTGDLEVVMKDGVHMLRASTPSTFRVRIPGTLPNDFTLEFDLIPKNCCNPEDLAFEGTPNIRQDEVSAYVQWHREHQRVVGGILNETYDRPMPPELSAVVPGTMTNVAVSVQGTTLRMFTNGTPIYSLQRAFARGAVLRVFLGGQDQQAAGRDEPVYLARLRIAGGPPAVTAAGAGPSALAPSANPVPNVGAGGGTTSSTNALGTTIVQNVTVTLGASGPIVNWQHGTAPSIFTVQRWKADDPACCSNTSPASPPLTAPPWQDSPPLLSGTYTYRVTATSSDGSAMAGTNFVYTRGTTRGTIVGSGPSPGLTPPFTVTVTMGTNGPVVTWPSVAQATGYRASRSHIDDLNCCNTSSGLRTYAATSPWQDQPLPISGTYLYQVVANTPNGQVIAETPFTFQVPGGTTAPAPAPVTALPISTPTATITPSPSTSTVSGTPIVPPTRGTPTLMNTGPVPTIFTVNGTTTRADLGWMPVSGATSYVIRRSVQGSSVWHTLTLDAVVPFTHNDYLPDHRSSYEYELAAYQADGTFGVATATFTPPPPKDPTGFTAAVTAPGQVRFEWDNVQDGAYLLTGPGAITGVTVMGAGNNPADRVSHTLTGIPAGTHTWTVASSYLPGGILTPNAGWPKATVTVTADPGPRYRLVALGFRAEQTTRDINDARDGHGDEVYLSAIVNQTRLSGVPLPVTSGASISIAMMRSHGDEAVSVPYGRIRAGTASTTGGIADGDLVPASLDLTAVTGPIQPNTLPLLLWEGVLNDGDAVVVHPALWEDDVNPEVHAIWLKRVADHATQGYAMAAATTLNINELLKRGSAYVPEPWRYYEPGALVEPLLDCTVFPFSLLRPEACTIDGKDRPIGLAPSNGGWFDRVILLTRSNIEAWLGPQPAGPLSSSYTFVVDQVDFSGRRPKSESTGTTLTGRYRLYMRVERLP